MSSLLLCYCSMVESHGGDKSGYFTCFCIHMKKVINLICVFQCMSLCMWNLVSEMDQYHLIVTTNACKWEMEHEMAYSKREIPPTQCDWWVLFVEDEFKWQIGFHTHTPLCLLSQQQHIFTMPSPPKPWEVNNAGSTASTAVTSPTTAATLTQDSTTTAPPVPTRSSAATTLNSSTGMFFLSIGTMDFILTAL